MGWPRITKLQWIPIKKATINHKDGETVTGNENIADIWMEYFEDLLNIYDDNPDNINRVIENDADNNPITMAELEAAIVLTRNNKSNKVQILSTI